MDEYASVKTVNCLYKDEEGRLWIGTNDGGVSIMIDETIINVVSEKEGLSADSVKCITQGSDGDYYIGTTDAMSIVSLAGGLTVKSYIDDINYAVSADSDKNGNIAVVSDNGQLSLVKNAAVTSKYSASDGGRIVSRECIITLITCVVLSIIIGACMVYSRKDEDKSIKVGIIYVGDASTAYTDNFIEALADIKEEYGDKVEIMHMYNVAEGTEREYLERLVNAGCNLIFSTSYNYGETTKELAGRYPDIQFCMATCSNANEEPYYANYHTFMGAIYEGRYAAGVAAGIKPYISRNNNRK